MLPFFAMPLIVMSYHFQTMLTLKESIMKEKSRLTRVSCNEKVLVQYSNNSIHALLMNISLRGALVLFPDNIIMHIGDKFQMTLNLKESGVVLRFSTEVRHCKKSFVGFKFIFMDSDTFIHLTKFILSRTGIPTVLLTDYEQLMREMIPPRDIPQ